MNIFLIPYTWWRHLQFGFWSAMNGLLFWWGYLLFLTVSGPFWDSSWDSFVTGFLLVFSCSVSNIWGEASLRRWSLKEISKKMLWLVLTSTGLSLLLFWLWHWLSGIFFQEADLVQHMVALKFRIGDFVCAGLVTGTTVLIVRKWESWTVAFNHVVGGVFAGLAASAVWSISAYYVVQNLYWAGALAFSSFGFFFGLAAWGIPDELFVGWVRVLKGSRFAQRIPIDASNQVPKERFLGHYPNGLDMYLPAQEGVLELHASIIHNPAQRQYILRGLSLEHTKMKRMFEWAKLDYDPQSPTPREVELQNGDRIELGQQCEIEFLILPREEK